MKKYDFTFKMGIGELVSESLVFDSLQNPPRTYIKILIFLKICTDLYYLF